MVKSRRGLHPSKHGNHEIRFGYIPLKPPNIFGFIAVKTQKDHPFLSNVGGLLPYYRFSGFFGAGRFGSGNQFVPFVHIRDVAKAIAFIANNEQLMDGAVNITAPEPCRNSDMLKELRWMRWGHGLPMPESVLKAIIGESSVVLTDSERVQPKRLLENGFEFDHPTIQESLHGLQ